MTTAESLALWFNLVPFVNKGDVEVTRSDSIDGKAYAFSIYFSGDSVAYNVPSVNVDRMHRYYLTHWYYCHC